MFELIHPKPDTSAYRRHAAGHYPALLQARPADSHKGTFGTVAVIGGGGGMIGAAVLAGQAALYSGCGKVIVGTNQGGRPVPLPFPELISQTAEAAAKQPGVDAWVIGCGLGRDEAAARALHTVWHSGAEQIVLDADALHLLTDHPKLFAPVRRSELVLTPHPGEAARLLDTGIGQVQGNRAWAAREIANRHRCWVVLKGHRTVISSARGFLHVNESGNAGLATAGSGDVLAGIIGSLLAQGMGAEQAVAAAVWLHGAAADLLVEAGIGPIGLNAGELCHAVRWLRNRLAA